MELERKNPGSRGLDRDVQRSLRWINERYRWFRQLSTQAFLVDREEMNLAIAPPTALGVANIIATPAVPADSSNPGRARNTHPNMRTLGASPQRRPVTIAPTALNRREKKTIPAVTNTPHTARYAKKNRSLFCQVWSGLITRTVTRSVPITTTSHADRARRCNLLKENM